jgi:hypothetical protein
MHGLNGYKEVIETVAWGLKQLGHQVTYEVNKFVTSATNIIFGAQVVSVAELKQMPKDTVIYNFEQLRAVQMDRVREQFWLLARSEDFKIWDYTHANLATWQALGRHDVRIVPVGYAPILTRIPRASPQDIDVLIYGLPSERRLQLFDALARIGLTTVFVSGLYGPARDELISRAKIVLNINMYTRSKIFEIVRVSYLLANKKVVVADLDTDTSIDDDIRTVVQCAASWQELPSTCVKLVESESARISLEEAGFAVICRRNIETILKAALPG